MIQKIVIPRYFENQQSTLKRFFNEASVSFALFYFEEYGVIFVVASV